MHCPPSCNFKFAAVTTKKVEKKWDGFWENTERDYCPGSRHQQNMKLFIASAKGDIALLKKMWV